MRKKKKRKSFILRVAISAFVLYIGVMLVGQSIQIQKKQSELSSLKAQTQAQKAKNEELNRLLTGNIDEYAMQIARDKLNYAQPNERIYIDVSGN